MEDAEFKQNIEELFRLFKRLIEKYPAEDLPGMSRFQYEQLKMFLNNYESMKDQISFEMANQTNEPMKQMLAMFIKQLRDQLGEEEKVEPTKTEEFSSDDAVQKLKKIDELLSRPGWSEDQIDRLLDQRLYLQQAINDKLFPDTIKE